MSNITLYHLLITRVFIDFDHLLYNVGKRGTVMERVKEQFKIIKEKGIDVSNPQKVMNEAVDLGYFELAIYVADHRNFYLDSIQKF